MNIMGRRWVYLGVFIVMTVAAIALLAVRGLNLGIDFTGGSLLERHISRPVTAGEVRSVLSSSELRDLGLGKSVVQPLENRRDVLIRARSLTNDEVARVDAALDKAFGKVEDRRTEIVGPVIGREILTKAFWALAIASVGILGYVAWRFEPRSGVTAVAALIHDVLVVLGLFALVGREINSSFVAAVLTVVGYSINDTIVVYDRIRENLRFRRKESFSQVVNDSILQTLARSINTGVSTVFTVTALYFLGGETIKDFALALLVGVVSGTYSSIFVASPLWVIWREREERRSALARAR